MSVIVEFRRICGANKDADQFFSLAAMDAVPACGEVINIEGEPFVVAGRSWALDVALYCYIRLSPYQQES